MEILIVGAGIAGLYNASELMKKGHKVSIIERSQNIGGTMQTLKYSYNNEEYFFDIGPHIPPNNFENLDWNELIKNVEKNDIPLPLRAKLILKASELTYPLNFSTMRLKDPFYLAKFAPSFIISALFKKKENNLEDSLINGWGRSFYKKNVKHFISNFWKADPSLLSKNYKARVSPPKIRSVLKGFFKKEKKKNPNLEKQNKTTRKSYPYPLYGMGEAIQDLSQKILKNGGSIKTNSQVVSISYSENEIKVKIQNSQKISDFKFDKVIWGGAISELIPLLPFEQKYQFEYRRLLVINLAVNTADILGDKIHASYIMVPNIIFHRVYEPNKLSSFMTPKNKSSICLEITLENKEINISNIISTATEQFCKIYSIEPNKVKCLGHSIYSDVYPYLYKSYETKYEQFREELRNLFQNIAVIGRPGLYSSITIGKTMESIVIYDNN